MSTTNQPTARPGVVMTKLGDPGFEISTKVNFYVAIRFFSLDKLLALAAAVEQS